eukprot:jgi/Galph1/4703/GphlegSOOS_G3403.1
MRSLVWKYSKNDRKIGWFYFFRSDSTNSTVPSETPKSENVEPSVLKHATEQVKFPNLFEAARIVKDHGIGKKFFLERWRRKGDFDSYWLLTRLERDNSGNPIKAFGYYRYKGMNIKEELEIEQARTRGWQYLPEPQGNPKGQ